MADDVVVYWVPFRGTMYAADMVARTYVGMSSPERLEAAQRALTFAGIPHKGWTETGRGEPNTMEEFGVQIRDADFLDGIITRIDASASQAVEHSAEARRMLGVLLGWNAPKEGSPEVAALPLLRSSQAVCVIDTDTGAWYAVAKGMFWHLRDFNEVGLLRNTGYLAGGQTNINHEEATRLRELVLRGNDELLPVPPPTTYTVQPGDSFNAIAKKLGVTPDALAAANPAVTDRNTLNKGQVLIVPK